jgi:Protein of unknown function DUF262
VTTESLKTLLGEVHLGRIQVPEFQRDWSWDDERIRGLLASVSLGYPIGALTLLEAGDPETRFETRPVPGAPSLGSRPERLLIDGLQRMTTLYQVFASGHAVQSAGKGEVPVWYYIDIRAALDAKVDRDTTIIAIPDMQPAKAPALQRDLSGSAMEYERCLFPLRLALGDPAELQRWLRDFATYGSDEQGTHRRELIGLVAARVVAQITDYALPVIQLGRETTRWSIRVHGGPDGPTLSDAYRVADSSE